VQRKKSALRLTMLPAGSGSFRKVFFFFIGNGSLGEAVLDSLRTDLNGERLYVGWERIFMEKVFLQQRS
jgi:hypothetical protein